MLGRGTPDGGRRAETLVRQVLRLVPQEQVQHDRPRAQRGDDEGERAVRVPEDERQQQLDHHDQHERQVLPGGRQEVELLLRGGWWPVESVGGGGMYIKII